MPSNPFPFLFQRVGVEGDVLLASGFLFAAGKHWEDWVKAYNEKKAAGEKNIALAPDALE